VVAALAGDHGQARRQRRQAARYTFYYPQEEYRPAFLDALGFCRNAPVGTPGFRRQWRWSTSSLPEA